MDGVVETRASKRGESGGRGLIERVKSSPPVSTALAVQARYSEDQAGMAASAIAFSGFFSVFPLLLVGASVLGFVLTDPAEQARWTERITEAVPGAGTLVGDGLSGLRDYRAATGLAGLAGLVWTGTGIVRAAGKGLGRIFDADMPEGFVRSNGWALASLGLLGTVWLVSTGAAGVLGTLAVGPLQAAGVAAVALAVDTGAFLVTYRLLVTGPGPSWRRLLPGSVLAAIGWTALKLAGTWYVVRTVSNARAVYGTFAGAIGLLALLLLGSKILMYGGVLNAVLMKKGGALVARSEAQARTTPAGEAQTRSTADEQRSTLTLVREIVGDTGTLVKKEVELAKQEILEAVGQRAKVARAYAIAGFLSLLALFFAGHAASVALGRTLPDWAGYAVFAGGLLVLAALIILIGRAVRRPAQVVELDQTKRTVKEDVEWAKAQLKR